MQINKYAILCVDDERNVLRSLKRLFFDTEYKIVTAESGEEGLKKLEEREIQVIISDYRMPGMNGVSFLSKVKDLYPGTIRIVLSGYADVASIVDAINEGHIYKFIAKPWNDQDLISTVQRAIEHFKLQKENSLLIEKLQETNIELKELSENLEKKVDERTRDLENKNRALEVAHKILNYLPVGVVGIDSDEMIVYINRHINHYIDMNALSLGESYKSVFKDKVLETISKSLEEKTLSHMVLENNEVSLICLPLPDKAGIIVTFGLLNPDKYEELFDEIQ